jgi:hypothetical protein
VIFTAIASILWSCNIKERKEGKAPWLDYGEFVIVRPNKWDIDIKIRDQWRTEALSDAKGFNQ